MCLSRAAIRNVVFNVILFQLSVNTILSLFDTFHNNSCNCFRSYDTNRRNFISSFSHLVFICNKRKSSFYGVILKLILLSAIALFRKRYG